MNLGMGICVRQAQVQHHHKRPLQQLVQIILSDYLIRGCIGNQHRRITAVYRMMIKWNHNGDAQQDGIHCWMHWI